MIKVHRERWEERIYHIDEVIMINDDGGQVGEALCQVESLKEMTDQDEIKTTNWHDVPEGHWLHKYMEEATDGI